MLRTLQLQSCAQGVPEFIEATGMTGALEISDEVFSSEENRLHTIKPILAATLSS